MPKQQVGLAPIIEEGAAAKRPRLPARRKAPLDRRNDLLAVAIDCLARLGPREATGREICRQAGVSHGLLRHYFRTPDNLFLETYKDLCDRYLARFEQRALVEDIDPWRPMDAFFEVLFSEEWASAELLGAWSAFWTLARTDEAFAQVNESHNQKLRALLKQAVLRLPAATLADVDLDKAIPMLSAVMDGLWLELCIRPDGAKRARAIELGRLALRRVIA